MPKPFSSDLVTPALTEVADEEEAKENDSQTCVIESDQYQKLKAKFRALKEHNQREMRTITEQLSELQAKVQKLEAISVTANTVTLQMQEQLSNL